jgi:choline dehydrogenase-like flavoprotein
MAAHEVVMSAGAIGTAQQLLLSGIGPADELSAIGVKPVHDLAGVGKDLQDHINIPITFYTKEKIGVGCLDRRKPRSQSGRMAADPEPAHLFSTSGSAAP